MKASDTFFKERYRQRFDHKRIQIQSTFFNHAAGFIANDGSQFSHPSLYL